MYLDLRIRPRAKKALVNILDMQALHKEIVREIGIRNNRTA